ncbi:MAG: glycosyltransferase [Chitinispirillaceae bacterium]|nr:glycosyltransferase [Chitinispirillaceae bacterium]
MNRITNMEQHAGRELCVRRTAAVVVFSHFPDDPRVCREAEAVEALGFEIDVFCIPKNGQSSRERRGSIAVYRFGPHRRRGARLRYLVEYVLFILGCTVRLSVAHLKRRYAFVHVHNMPDFLVFCAVVPKLLGARIILDLHDPTPEVYRTKYLKPDDSWMVALLRTIERVCIGFASVVFTPNLAFKRLFVARGCPEQKISIIMNSPLSRVFQSAQPAVIEGPSRFRVMYHGTIVKRHGLDIALKAVQKLRTTMHDIEFIVFGGGDGFIDIFLRLVEQHRITDVVRYLGEQSIETIARYVKAVDVGIIPNRKTVFTEINFPTRIFEYLIAGKPVIVPRTQGILDYFDDNSLFFFEAGSAESLAGMVSLVRNDPMRTKAILERASERFRANRWELQQQRLQEIVGALVPSAGTAEALRHG